MVKIRILLRHEQLHFRNIPIRLFLITISLNNDGFIHCLLNLFIYRISRVRSDGAKENVHIIQLHA